MTDTQKETILKNIIRFSVDYEKKMGRRYCSSLMGRVKALYCDYVDIYGSEEDFDREPDDFYEKMATGELFDKIFEREEHK